MNVLLLGSGGREHAIAWKLSQSPKLDKLYIAPGNSGTRSLGKNVIDCSTFEEISDFVTANNIEMVVVGPENPLVEGIHDYLNEHLPNVAVIGPKQNGAKLEGSKSHAKDFMKKHSIPTARYQVFNEAAYQESIGFLKTLEPPYVIKADGLAAGKGVVIVNTLEEAEHVQHEILVQKQFGSAGSSIVIEEFLPGIELSVFVLTDGISYKIMPSAKDYKRIGENDTGLNTGGMGAISPVQFADVDFMTKVETKVIQPTLDGLRKDGVDYTGFLYFGLMNVGGNPYVIEYNVRMGDPETEVVLPRLKTDLLELFIAVSNKTLSGKSLEFDQRTAATVMLVSGGYPEKYDKGKLITGLENIDSDVIVFHAGTVMTNDKLVTNGGRVLSVTACGNSMDEALNKCYMNAEKIHFEGKFLRKDIGFDLKKAHQAIQ